MKLNPPASSSDLDLARAVARRLHERAQRQGHPAPPGEEPAPPHSAAPPPVFPRPRPAFQPAAPAPVTAPSASQPEGFAPPDPEDRSADAPVPEAPGVDLAEPEPVAPESIDVEAPAAVSPPESELAEEPESEPEPEPGPNEDVPLSLEPPVAEEPPPDEGEMPPVDTPVFEPPVFDPNEAEPAAAQVPPSEAPEQADPFSAELARPPLDEPAAPEAAASQDDPWAAEAEDALSELAGEEPSLAGLEPPAAAYEENPGAGVEDLLGGAPAPVAPPALEPEPESPFDVVGDPGTGEVAVEPDELAGSPGPSWDEVAEAAMALAGAHGAMLVDTSGQVLTARGEWPEPGPDAIAGRLVSMMDRTLQEAPTRSVSAPIAGQHLTAWRIPASEGYLTVVFMGEAPLSADVRPDIDEHIRGALG